MMDENEEHLEDGSSISDFESIGENDELKNY
jgi:hypothetical protein